MTATAKQPAPEEDRAHTQGLGDESSIWFKLTPLLKGGRDNPMRILMQMAERYGPVIPVNLANQRIVLLTDPEHFKYVLVTKADSYIKYFDGLKPIFGKSMITNDGALWQKIRMPQQPAFHPDMFAEYIPYFLAAIRTKMDLWAKLAKSGETFEMVEQTWTLAADMICKALFDRDMPFNPHFVFKCVKTYTDVMNHKEIRLKRSGGRGVRDHGGGRRQGHGSLGERTAGGFRRRPARGARAHAAEDDRGRGRRSVRARVRPPAGRSTS